MALLIRDTGDELVRDVLRIASQPLDKLDVPQVMQIAAASRLSVVAAHIVVVGNMEGLVNLANEMEYHVLEGQGGHSGVDHLGVELVVLSMMHALPEPSDAGTLLGAWDDRSKPLRDQGDRVRH